MIHTVFFDLGNVILPLDVMRLANALNPFSTVPVEEIPQKIWNDTIWDQFETGQMSPVEYYTHISRVIQLKGIPFEQFVPLFNDIFDKDKQVMDLIYRLKKNYALGLISNTNPIHADFLYREYAILSAFDHILFSNEVGSRKPDPQIFKAALTRFSVPPEQALFIDDMKDNITTAHKLGLKTIHYRNYQNLQAELAHLGVEH